MFRRSAKDIADRFPVGGAPAREGECAAPGEDARADGIDFCAETARLCRRRLDGLTPDRLEARPEPGDIRFLRLTRVPRPVDRAGNAAGGGARACQFFTAAHGLGAPAVIRFEQRAGEIHVLLGLRCAQASEAELDLLGQLLRGHFAGCECESAGSDAGPGGAIHAAVLAGVPQPRDDAPKLDRLDLGTLASALPREDFGLTLVAAPVPTARNAELAAKIEQQIDAWSPFVRMERTVSAQAAAMLSRTTHREHANRAGQLALEWLEVLLRRYHQGHREGLWEWHGVLWARSPGVVRVLGRLACALYAGEESLPEPVRVLPVASPEDAALLAAGAGRPYADGEPLSTFVSSREAGALLALPVQSFPGFQTTPAAPFSTAGAAAGTSRTVSLGTVLDRGTSTGRPLRIPLDELAKHTLVAGMTGSGKTNTCMSLLGQAAAHGIPFLVVEPAKAEYRGLLRSPLCGERLQVFTPGDETTSPFRINPFEFPEGFSVSTHMDFLKSVFVAAFSMYGPMPHLLERAIVRVYERRGWDLARGVNRHEGQVERAHLMPTLRDLLREVEAVVDAAGYARELSMDIRAALCTRIGSLLTGAKGMMLGGIRSTPIEALLARPTVIELRALGDDQEKAFLMGLLLVRLYEYRQASPPPAEALVHLTLIEEAHRLLRNVPASGDDPESANVTGKAVEAFCNILAEVRAYGEGIIIAEQIPAKLAPDAVKNTGLKLVHRLHAPDDRQVMSASMVLGPAQSSQIAWLPPLSACAFGGGIEEAVLLAATHSKPEFDAGFQPPSNVELARRAEAGREENPAILERFPGCHVCARKCAMAPEAMALLEEPGAELHRTVRRFAAAWLLAGPDRAAPIRRIRQFGDDAYCVAVHLAHCFVEERRAFLGLNAAESVRLQGVLAPALAAGEKDVQERVGAFLDLWIPLLRRKWTEQTVLCRECAMGACIGFEMAGHVRDPDATADFSECKDDDGVFGFLRRLVEKRMGTRDPVVFESLSRCFLIHKYATLGIDGAADEHRALLKGRSWA